MCNMVKTDIICPNCGEGHLIREEPTVIKSNTAAYSYSCPDCCFVHTAKSDEDMKEWINSLDKPIEEEILKEQVQDFLTPVAKDVVNHPSHYETGKFECFDVMREIYGDAVVKNFSLCNAFKYLYRYSRKNGIEDIRKAKWYIDHFLEIVDEEERNV